MNSLHTEMNAIVRALSAIRTPAVPGEYDLHAEVSAALTRAQIAHRHEYKLAPRCRIDFIAGRVGIEIKKGRPAPAALRGQLSRYLQSGEVDAVVVVVQQSIPLPRTLAGKPVELVSLNRLWGVALP